MNDKKLIATIWNDMVLRRRLDNNPYSLSCSELELLRNQEKFDDIVNGHEISTHEKLLKSLNLAGYRH